MPVDYVGGSEIDRLPAIDAWWEKIVEVALQDDEAVPSMARPRASLLVLGLDCVEAVEPGGLAEGVELGDVFAEDRGLDRAIRRPERREAVLSLHVFRDLKSAKPLDLPLR